MRRLLVAPLILALAACTTPEEQAARQAAIEQYDHNECIKIGFRPGTPEYGDCRLRQKEMRIEERALNRPRYYPDIGIHYGYHHYRR